MQRSLQSGSPARMPDAKARINLFYERGRSPRIIKVKLTQSVAAGLAPPFAGENAFKHVRKAPPATSMAAPCTLISSARQNGCH